MQLSFHYSPDYELFRVKYTLKKLGFYTDNGYTVDLPPGVTETSSSDDIKAAIERDFNESMYSAYGETLQAKCAEHADIISALQAEGIIRTEPYTIYLTRYGVGGSYGPPDEVVLKVWSPEVTDRTLGTLLHELIHLKIAWWVEDFEVSHWRTERLVDLVGQKFFPQLREAQAITEDVQIVDAAFAAHFPDLARIVAEISPQGYIAA